MEKNAHLIVWFEPDLRQNPYTKKGQLFCYPFVIRLGLVC